MIKLWLMETVELKKKLHEYIELADEEQLSVFHHLAEGSTVQTGKYADEEIAIFEKRREDYLNGIGLTYSIEESFAKIRQAKG